LSPQLVCGTQQRLAIAVPHDCPFGHAPQSFDWPQPSRTTPQIDAEHVIGGQVPQRLGLTAPHSSFAAH